MQIKLTKKVGTAYAGGASALNASKETIGAKSASRKKLRTVA